MLIVSAREENDLEQGGQEPLSRRYLAELILSINAPQAGDYNNFSLLL
jgi:CHASE2 domain-containing sensor protein